MSKELYNTLNTDFDSKIESKGEELPGQALSAARERVKSVMEEELRPAIVGNEFEVVKQLLQHPANANGEFYKYYFDTTLGYFNPAGNTVLLLALSKHTSNPLEYGKPQASLANEILNDAKEKLSPSELKAFVSANFQGKLQYEVDKIFFNHSPLILAIKAGLFDLAIDLTEKYGANTKNTCFGGYTALHLIVAKAYLCADDRLEPIKQVIDSLIKHGANINALNDFGHSPVDLLGIDPFDSKKVYREKSAEYILGEHLKYGDKNDINLKNLYDSNDRIISEFKSEEIIKLKNHLLLKKNISSNEIISLEKAPDNIKFHIEDVRKAIMDDDSKQLEELLSSAENSTGEFYQYYFDKTNDYSKIDGYNSHHDQDPAGNTLLLSAIARAAFNSDKTKANSMVDAILSDAEKKLPKEQLKSFVSAEFNQEIFKKHIGNEDKYFQHSPLILAIKTDLLDVALRLINDGADLEDKSCIGGYTALHLAVTKLHFIPSDKKLQEVVYSLISNGANINAIEDYGHKPIDLLKWDDLNFGASKQYRIISKAFAEQVELQTNEFYSLQDLMKNKIIKEMFSTKYSSNIELSLECYSRFKDFILEGIRDGANNRAIRIDDTKIEEIGIIALLHHMNFSELTSSFDGWHLHDQSIPNFNLDDPVMSNIRKSLGESLPLEEQY